jgi:hypothetical protein
MGHDKGHKDPEDSKKEWEQTISQIKRFALWFAAGSLLGLIIASSDAEAHITLPDALISEACEDLDVKANRDSCFNKILDISSAFIDSVERTYPEEHKILEQSFYKASMYSMETKEDFVGALNAINTALVNTREKAESLGVPYNEFEYESISKGIRSVIQSQISAPS